MSSPQPSSCSSRHGSSTDSGAAYCSTIRFDAPDIPSGGHNEASSVHDGDGDSCGSNSTYGSEDDDFGANFDSTGCSASQGAAEGASSASQPPPRIRRRHQKQARMAWLAPCWDVVAEDPLLPDGHMGICTRALFHRVHGLAFAVCAYCEKRWWARHLFSVVWPSSQLRDHALNPADPPTFHAPVHQNLGHLAPVRINDVAVSGVRLRRDKRTGRPTSAQYQLLGISGDGRGLSTQFISFGRKALRYVLAPQSFLWRWYRILHHHRPELECVWSHLWGSPECDNRQDLKREVPKVAFGTCSREATWVAQVKRRPPASREEVSARRAILRKGAAGWVMPRVLPQTPQNAITAALHALLVVRSIRATLLQHTDADIDVKHPTYDTLAMVFRGLFRGDIPDRQLFKELKELLTMPHGLLRDRQLTSGQSRCAHTVLDTLLTRIFVRSSVGHDLPTMFRPTWPRHAGIVLPPAFAPCALRCTLRDPPPSDLLWHLNNLVAQWPSNERLGICGPVLLVYVDCTAITCDVTFPLILPFFGRYVLRLYCTANLMLGWRWFQVGM